MTASGSPRRAQGTVEVRMMRYDDLDAAVAVLILLAFGANTSLLVAGIAVAVWQPAVALSLALVSSAPTVLLLRRVPRPYRNWF